MPVACSRACRPPCLQLLHLQTLSKVHGFISFAFQPDLLSRFINFVMWILMTGTMTWRIATQGIVAGGGQGPALISVQCSSSPGLVLQRFLWHPAVKYVTTLHNSTKSLLPRLPHLLIAVRRA